MTQHAANVVCLPLPPEEEDGSRWVTLSRLGGYCINYITDNYLK